MNETTVPYNEEFNMRLQDPEYAHMFLEAAMEETCRDNDYEAFLLVIREVVNAQGGIPHLARKMNIPKQTLYKVLSSDGNPRLDTLNNILRHLGLRVSIAVAS